MRHRTTYTNVIKIYKLTPGWIRSGLTVLAQRMFAAPDATARRRGWQVSPTPGGFGRRYRDPRFDTLTSCGECLGRGAKPASEPCPTCRGTGRITVRPADEPPPGAPKGLA